MGFKDAEWAYTLDLPLAQKVVLVAVCHRTDDKRHETFVGHETVASMVGASTDTVRRAMRDLDTAGIITRKRRSNPHGYRTSDLITVNRQWAPDLTSTAPTRQSAYKAERRNLTGTQPLPNQQSAGAIDHSEDHSEDHSVNTVIVELEVEHFEDFYSAWPRKVAKPAARKAWAKAIKLTDPDTILDAAIAYRDNPGRPQQTYIPHPATWLNREGWNDELPTREAPKQTPSDRVNDIVNAGQKLLDRQRSQAAMAKITTLRTFKEIS